MVNDLGGTMTVAMTYHGDVGSNDEYTAQIPTSYVAGCGLGPKSTSPSTTLAT